jgi:hypothetical protein
MLLDAIDKYEKKIYYCENFKNKRPKKMIWPFLVPQQFLEVIISGTT